MRLLHKVKVLFKLPQLYMGVIDSHVLVSLIFKRVVQYVLFLVMGITLRRLWACKQVKTRAIWTDGRAWLLPPSDVEDYIINLYLHERFLVSLMKTLCKNRVFIDVGSSYGLWILRLHGVYHKVIAIEPDRETAIP